MENVDTVGTIYKVDSANRLRLLTIDVGWNNENHAGYRTHSGLVTGQTVTSAWNRSEGKNIGKINETTSKEQAYKEAESIMKLSLEGAYGKSPEEAYSVKDRHFKPMLAHGYKAGDVSFPVFSQPKLDGIRCIAKADGLYTRSGKPIVSCPHIFEELEPFFAANPHLILDGELYNHELKDNFNKITSMVRKTKDITEEVLIETANKVEYHIYDAVVVPGMNLSDRFLRKFVELSDTEDFIQVVETRMVHNEEELDRLYGEYLENGYEGQMVRSTEAEYENRRSKALLKRKEFITEEFKVIDALEGNGNWAGYVKRFLLDLGDGREFGAGVRGTQEVLKDLLESKNTPDWATVRYFTPTPDGIPRFPVVIDWGWGERTD